MNFPEIYSATGMMELILKIGFLPLLDSGIEGFSAEDIVTDDCGYVTFSEGGWDWPLLNTPEELYGREACQCNRTPEESYQRNFEHLKEILPDASDKRQFHPAIQISHCIRQGRNRDR